VRGAPVFDSVLIEMEGRMIRDQDAVLLGRNMYDEWSGYWPTSDEQPFADFIK
jgi:dihydrofolate reductase